MNRDLELKKAIIEWLFEHKDNWQLANSCVENFRDYIYDKDGHYLIGGENVSDFIKNIIGLLF